MARSRKLHPRDRYLEEAMRFRDTDLVKVVTGIRRCGKSSLLELVRAQIELESDVPVSCVSANLEARGLGVRTDDDLYEFMRSNANPEARTYYFLDEVQRVEGWHDVVNSMRVEQDCDIYLTGSNAQLLSGELATYLSGRYVEVRMLPLSLSEYLDFCGVTFAPGKTISLDASGEPVSFEDVFLRYLRYGGMPAIASLSTTQAEHAQYMDGVFNTVVVRDVMGRGRGGEAPVTDPDLLRIVSEYLADTVGRQSSVKRMADAINAGGRSVSHRTLGSYMRALEASYVIYPCKRYDIHGRAILKTMPKYYLVDMGMRQYLNGYRGSDVGLVFENAVYLQLLYEGWQVSVGKLYQSEVDFVASRDGRTVYLQVTDRMDAESTRERELGPLRSIRDSHEKVVVTRIGDSETLDDGIRVVRARDFFLGEER